jgi:hypothetical protein
MKTVRDCCELQPNALSVKLSDQIEQLDQLIGDETAGEDFFQRTHFTQGMKDLATEGIARLAGASSQAIFHLKQAMGGGKTHLLVGFGLLAKHPALRARHCAGVAYADAFGSTAIAAFNGRNTPPHFYWGEIAEQVGKGEQFRKVWTCGPRAPDERDWIALFEGDQPILRLLDEMPPYFHYLDTQRVGNGTVADIATRAFANLLTAAGKKKNVCIVVSDLAAAYDTGERLINRALQDARSELGRQERNITPVDLAGNEIYEILRKRLFAKLPDRNEIAAIADTFGRKLEEASRSKIIARGSEAIAEEIEATYPFHPRLKNVIALFKENEQFKQTRGLIELVSRLLRSVWERKANDVVLIGAQHFDLSIPEVRDKLTEISGMRDVIANDLWDAQKSSHAQVIDLNSGRDTAQQVGTLLFTASLSTAVNAVKGLTREEVVECLVSPFYEPSEWLSAFDELEKAAWYIHRTPELRFYFDRQENLTKLLERLAHDAPENQVEDLIRDWLRDMFKPIRKSVYAEVLPLPRLEEVVEKVRKGRLLLVVSPDSKIPPDQLKKFFDGLTQKNNLCVLTGDNTAMGSLEKAARNMFAAYKAQARIPETHAQRGDLVRRQRGYEQAFNGTVLRLFNKVLIPIQRAHQEPRLAPKPLDKTRDALKPFNGEQQIEQTLTPDPVKLFLDIEANFDTIRDKAQDLLWPANQTETRWSDALDRYAEQAGMYWLPPGGLETLRSIATTRGVWEDLGNGYVSRQPKPKLTSAQIVPEWTREDGTVQLRINAVNGGPAPRIHYSQDSAVSESSPVLKESTLTTKALRVAVLVRDISGQHQMGDPVVWTNKLQLRNQLTETHGKRTMELFVAPRGDIRYTLDGSEPRNGIDYAGSFPIDERETLIRVFASADGVESKADFRIPARGRGGVQIDETTPATLVSPRIPRKLDSRLATFKLLQHAADRAVTFETIALTVGQGSRMAHIHLGEIASDAAFIRELLERISEKLEPDAPVTMTFRIAHFKTGRDLLEFADKLEISLEPGDVEQ